MKQLKIKKSLVSYFKITTSIIFFFIVFSIICSSLLMAQANQKGYHEQFGTIYDPAFQDLIKKRYPMTPEQIKALQKIYRTMNKAEKITVDTPTPVVSTRYITIAPGTVPPVIKLALGYISTLVFLDETGRAWPVAAYNNGNSKAFDIQTAGGSDKGSMKDDSANNLLMIMAKESGVTGNLVVFLRGMPNSTPLVFTLVTGQSNVDYRLDLRVQGRSPYAAKVFANATSMTGQSGTGAFSADDIEPNVDPVMMALLDGLPPKGAQPLLVSGAKANVWMYNKKLLIRTRLDIVSPHYDSIMSSADGTKVYKMNRTPMILASQNGKTVSIKLKGF